MDLFQAIEERKSVRKFTKEKVPEEVIMKALENAVLAPNSSNLQTWDFYWVKSEDKKEKLTKYCLSQSAARTAAELIVITADPNKWKRSLPYIQKYAKSVNAPKPVIMYYTKLVPYFYRYGWLNCLGLFKSVVGNITALFRPMMRGPHFRAELQEVAVKSAALAAQNFVLSITAQGYSSCMMEGFDHRRVKKMLGLARASRVVMIIAVGKEGERGRWGPRFRIDSSHVIHQI